MNSRFTWNSRPERSYTVSYSTDLINWSEFTDDVPSMGDMTTYSYGGGFGAPEPDPDEIARIYLRVSENPVVP